MGANCWTLLLMLGLCLTKASAKRVISWGYTSTIAMTSTLGYSTQFSQVSVAMHLKIPQQVLQAQAARVHAFSQLIQPAQLPFSQLIQPVQLPVVNPVPQVAVRPVVAQQAFQVQQLYEAAGQDVVPELTSTSYIEEVGPTRIILTEIIPATPSIRISETIIDVPTTTYVAPQPVQLVQPVRIVPQPVVQQQIITQKPIILPVTTILGPAVTIPGPTIHLPPITFPPAIIRLPPVTRPGRLVTPRPWTLQPHTVSLPAVTQPAPIVTPNPITLEPLLVTPPPVILNPVTYDGAAIVLKPSLRSAHQHKLKYAKYMRRHESDIARSASASALAAVRAIEVQKKAVSEVKSLRKMYVSMQAAVSSISKANYRVTRRHSPRATQTSLKTMTVTTKQPVTSLIAVLERSISPRSVSGGDIRRQVNRYQRSTEKALKQIRSAIQSSLQINAEPSPRPRCRSCNTCPMCRSCSNCSACRSCQRRNNCHAGCKAGSADNIMKQIVKLNELARRHAQDPSLSRKIRSLRAELDAAVARTPLTDETIKAILVMDSEPMPMTSNDNFEKLYGVTFVDHQFTSPSSKPRDPDLYVNLKPAWSRSACQTRCEKNDDCIAFSFVDGGCFGVRKGAKLIARPDTRASSGFKNGFKVTYD